ncbi:MAG TPA: type VI secretion system tube protein Hcp [Vicinamibacterales bacterium]|jgi:type VI secretion system secreted protein Hcp
MKTTSRVSAALLLAAGFALAPRASAADAFIRFDGVEGESTHKDHRDWMVVSSFSFDQLARAQGSGRVSFHDISVTKRVDKASPALAKAAASGRHFPTATVSVRKAGGGQQEYLVVKLQDIMVSSYRTAGGGNAQTESFVLNASNATVENAGAPAQGPGVKGLQPAPGTMAR